MVYAYETSYLGGVLWGCAEACYKLHMFAIIDIYTLLWSNNVMALCRADNKGDITMSLMRLFDQIVNPIRKIECCMVYALQQCVNKTGAQAGQVGRVRKDTKDWKMGNTSIEFDKERNQAHIMLHGNCIAIVDYGTGIVFPNVHVFREWPTPTTRSRLRALGIDASLKKGCPYIGDWPIMFTTTNYQFASKEIERAYKRRFNQR